MHLLRAEYKVENNMPVIYLFCRENGKRVIQMVNNFTPYFYVPDGETNVHDLRMKYENKLYESINGEKIRKAFTILPSDVPKIRDKFSKSFEADVLFPTRYMIDRVDSLEYTEPKVMYLDIEVDSSGHMPKLDLAMETIICIGIYDSLDKTYISFVNRADVSVGTDFKILNDCLHEIRYFRNEIDMLRNFVEFIHNEGPDVLCGWNLVRFDLTYILNRLDRLGFDVNRLSPINGVWAKTENEIIIKGVALIDLYDAYRKMTFNYEESYKLEYISQKVVGEGKVAIDNIRWLWKMELDKLVEYNIQDARLVYLIDKKLGLLSFLDELRRLCFCQLEDTLVQSKCSDSYILRLFHGRKVFPTKTEHERAEFEGAMVGSWAKGIYENVANFDIRSLYPSTIVTMNLSPETFVEGGDIHVNGCDITSKVKGFLPEVIENLFKERARYKQLMKAASTKEDKDMYDSRQKATKILLNALYGQTAFPHSRLYYPKIAETITFVGRNIITWSKDFLEELGYKVHYIDTDGIFFQLDEHTDPEVIRGLLNDSYTQFCAQFIVKHHIYEMEAHSIFRKIFFGQSKKRYAGSVIWKDGEQVDELEVIGFEVRRSDSSQFSRTLQKTAFDMLLRQDKPKDEVLRYIGGEIDRIRKGEYHFAEIGIPKGITRDLADYGNKITLNDMGAVTHHSSTPINVRGARYARDVLGYELSSKPKMIYVSKLPDRLPSEFEDKPVNIICFDDDNQVPPGTQIDTEKMLEKLVKSKIESIFEALGWSLRDLDVHWKGKAPKKGVQNRMTL